MNQQIPTKKMKQNKASKSVEIFHNLQISKNYIEKTHMLFLPVSRIHWFFPEINLWWPMVFYKFHWQIFSTKTVKGK